MENTEKKEFGVRTADTNALAFMGDAVYEVHVRKMMVGKGLKGADLLHKKTVQYVNANAQANAIKRMFDDLEAEEQTLVKRARNHKSATKAKHTDPVTYKWSTAFEALLGWLYLQERFERLEEIMTRATNIIYGKED